MVRKNPVSRWISSALAMALLWGVAVQGAPAKFKATLIDREGNRYEVERLMYQERTELEYYVGEQRRIRSFKWIDRILFQGGVNDEEQSIVVHLRQGGKETGAILNSGSGVPRASQTLGRGYTTIDFSGVSQLGPFSMRLSDVRELIFRHPKDEVVEAKPVLKADLITLKGERFSVEELRYMGQERFEFTQSRNRRRPIPMHKIEIIDFAEIGSGEEKRPVTISLWSGKVLQGVVDVSMVRLPGETDRVYFNRRNASFTGRGPKAPFTIGMQDLRQIRFRKAEEEEVAEEIPEEGGGTAASKGGEQ